MFTIIGLGNPGGEYAKTRHNAGRMVSEIIAEKAGIELKEKKKPPHRVGSGLYNGSTGSPQGGEKVRVVLPDTFMNKSGAAATPYIKGVAAAKKLVIIHDEIDLPLGRVKVSFGSSSGGHKGVESVARAIKTKNFVRIRVGVSKAARGVAKKPAGDTAVHDFLLGTFTKGELDTLTGPVFKNVELALERLFETGDPVMAMNAVNGLSV
jgi:PTH1 family peptidyl-tRNA hydrolase